MPSTSSHTRIRLSGKGLKKVNGYGHGDHYVNFKIVVPKRLQTKQKALIQAYAELEEDTPGQILGVTRTNDGSETEGIEITGSESKPQAKHEKSSGILGKIKSALFGRKNFNEENKILSSIRSALVDDKTISKSNKNEDLLEDKKNNDIIAEPKRETNG